MERKKHTMNENEKRKGKPNNDRNGEEKTRKNTMSNKKMSKNEGGRSGENFHNQMNAVIPLNIAISRGINTTRGS